MSENTTPNTKTSDRLGLESQLQEELDALLSVGYPDSPKQRQRLLRSWVQHELRALSLPVGSELPVLTAEQAETLMARCRYYAAQELLVKHCQFQRGLDASLREDLLIYLQDQLLRDDFKRLRQYDSRRGAALKTWLGHVLANITLDFLRQRKRHDKVVLRGLELDESGSVSVGGDTVFQPEDGAETSEQNISRQQLTQLLENLFDGGESEVSQVAGGSAGGLDGQRDRLREVLEMKPSEQLFLKMIYVSELNPEEAGERIGLGKNQAYGLQRRLQERIAAAAKKAGVLDDLLDLANNREASVTLLFEGQAQRAQSAEMRQFKKASTQVCSGWWVNNGISNEVEIEEGFGSLHRRLYGSCSLIQSAESVVDQHLQSLDGNELTLRDLDQRFNVHSRYIRPLRALLSQNGSANS